jgi:hypothetical protein
MPCCRSRSSVDQCCLGGERLTNDLSVAPTKAHRHFRLFLVTSCTLPPLTMHAALILLASLAHPTKLQQANSRPTPVSSMHNTTPICVGSDEQRVWGPWTGDLCSC